MNAYSILMMLCAMALLHKAYTQNEFWLSSLVSIVNSVLCLLFMHLLHVFLYVCAFPPAPCDHRHEYVFGVMSGDRREINDVVGDDAS